MKVMGSDLGGSFRGAMLREPLPDSLESDFSFRCRHHEAVFLILRCDNIQPVLLKYKPKKNKSGSFVSVDKRGDSK